MAYTIRRFDGTELVVLEDGTIDISTSVSLVGRNYTGYGELQNQNFLYLLENFSNDAPPSRPIKGQTWFNTLNNNLNVYDGDKWSIVGNAVISEIAPIDPVSGTLWFDSVAGRLNCWVGQWIQIGPETSPGFGETRTKSTTLLSTTGQRYAVIMMIVNDVVVAIISSASFTIDQSERPVNFVDLIAGINFQSSSNKTIKGNVDGAVSKASTLETPRTINGVSFDGSRDITISSSTTGPLIAGDYLLGNNFSGASSTTWRVDATPNNVIGTVVARSTGGDFSAGTITADLVGDVQGNVFTNTGTSTFNRVVANEFVGAVYSGNADTATKLRTARTINGVSFNGSENVTVPVDGNNITGTRIANNVVNSNLSTLGTLAELFVDESGAEIGGVYKLLVDSGKSKIVINNSHGLTIDIQDTSTLTDYSSIEFISAAKNLSQGGENSSALVPKNSVDLGSTYQGFNKIYADRFVGTFEGTSSQASSSQTSTNLSGGAAGAIPYQSAAGTTGYIPPGVAGQILRSSGTGEPVWGAATFSLLSKGNYLTGVDYDGIVTTTWSVDATPNNVAEKVVARDASGNFSAGTITADLNGNANTVSSITAQQISDALGYVPATSTAGNITSDQVSTALGFLPLSSSTGVTVDTTQNISGPKTFLATLSASEVIGSSTSSRLRFQYHDFTADSSIYYFDSRVRCDVDSFNIFDGSSVSFNFKMANVTKPGGGSFGSFSDIRLKKDVAEYEKGLESIIALKPIKYKFNDTYYDKIGIDVSDKEYVGLSAQDLLETQFANCVGEENGYYSIDSSEIIWALVNSIKELNTKIDVLQTELAKQKQ